ncbi:hypothetical protein [Prescottella equi]
MTRKVFRQKMLQAALLAKIERETPLNARQLKVLQLVGASCPVREWPDSTYKTVGGVPAGQLITRP